MKRLINIFLCTIVFLILGIISKSNSNYKALIHYYLYEDSFNFNSVYSFYNKYLGGISLFDLDKNNTMMVNDDKIKYNSVVSYYDGLKLNVDNNYLISNFSDGIVSFIGKKDKYGSVIIIKTSDNIDIWYGNICNSNLKIYDDIKKGEYIGQSCSNYIYIVYVKNGIFLNWKKFFN